MTLNRPVDKPDGCIRDMGRSMLIILNCWSFIADLGGVVVSEPKTQWVAPSPNIGV
jgi:hypothetical protein